MMSGQDPTPCLAPLHLRLQRWLVPLPRCPNLPCEFCPSASAQAGSSSWPSLQCLSSLFPSDPGG